MSDESQNQTDQAQDNNSEKQTNRVFTQSELDSMVAAEKRKVQERYSDYDDLQQKLSEMEAQAKERAEAEMSELEKANSTIKELTGRMQSLESENINYKQETLRNDVLSDPKFNALPRAYKKMVSLADDKDSILQSAETVLKEYEQDFGSKKPDIKPAAVNSDGQVPGGAGSSVSNFSEGVKARMANLIKNRGN